MIDLTPILEAVCTLAVILITTFVIPAIKAHTSATTREEASKWVTIAVQAAEQVYTGSGMGTKKKEFVTEWLAQHNVTVDTEKLDTMIESAVYELKAAAKAAEATPTVTTTVTIPEAVVEETTVTE